MSEILFAQISNLRVASVSREISGSLRLILEMGGHILHSTRHLNNHWNASGFHDCVVGID